MASLHDLRRPTENGSLEEKKDFIRAFIHSITVRPAGQRLDIQMQELPAGCLPQPGLVSVGVVARALLRLWLTDLFSYGRLHN